MPLLNLFQSNTISSSDNIVIPSPNYPADKTGNISASVVFQKAIDDAYTNNKIITPLPGRYRITTPLIPKMGVNIIGPNTFALGEFIFGTELFSDTDDIFYSDTFLSGFKISGTKLTSQIGGKHIFNLRHVSHIELYNIACQQLNTDWAIFYSVSYENDNTAFSNFSLHHFDFRYETNNIVPPVFISNPNVFNVSINMGSISRTIDNPNGDYAIHIQSSHSTNPIINVSIDKINFSAPAGGAVKLLSSAASEISNCIITNQLQVPANPIIFLDKYENSVPSVSNRISQLYSKCGDNCTPDVKVITSNNNVLSTTIIGGNFNVLDGDDPNGEFKQVVILNSTIDTIQYLNSSGIDNESLSISSGLQNGVRLFSSNTINNSIGDEGDILLRNSITVGNTIYQKSNTIWNKLI